MIEQMAKDAVEVIRTVLLPAAGLSAAKAAAGAAGKAIFDWCKGKLTGPAEADALAKVEANPKSDAAAKMLTGALELRLENEQALLKELGPLLKAATGGDYSVRQTMTVTGNNNRSTQIVGNSNKS